jgi:hypothetical protein|tara:strand:+ start:113 stop:3541 length:3429 start_codon:yes stop_codon:yes gene_type:complete
MNKLAIILIFTFLSCKDAKDPGLKNTDKEQSSKPLFTLLGPKETGVSFINLINESATVNGMLYEYLYNGGGVSVGDLNGDDLPDLYFISNLYANKLFINKGNMVFEETTLSSNVKDGKGFPTGVSMVDINSDGKLDIYICKSGNYIDLDYRRNELYINQGNNENGIPLFKEQASKYNLDLPHYSTQASFFDYDKDGDLDMFLINHGIDPGETESNIKKLINTQSVYSSERLFRNDDGKFTDVSKSSGIINNGIGYGLGVAIGDLNNDQWPDIVVSHDYSEKDHLYINKKDGSFEEVITEATNHISNFSMGNDIGDINNDGLFDFISVDMVSNNNYDSKTSMSGMDSKRFQNLVDLGLHNQYMSNALQLNNGSPSNKNTPVFSEISEYAGISNTNWSWAPLLFDMNNDGWQDLFVSNGILRSFRNNDFVIYKRKRNLKLEKDRKELLAQVGNGSQEEFLLVKKYYEDLLEVMPRKKEVNLFYLNNKDLSFSSMNEDWKLNTPSATNGAAYADLDNDGDLDIIGNNVNDIAFIYRNNTRELNTAKSNYLKIKLEGSQKNKIGIGAKVTIVTDSIEQTKELYLTRGFQSSVSDLLHFGVGKSQTIEKITVTWPDGKSQTLKEVQVNQQLNLNHSDAETYTPKDIHDKTQTFKTNNKITFNYKHTENSFDDFEREILLPHKFSQNGPALATGDVNNDGLDDFYIGGAKDQSAVLFLQQANGDFSSVRQPWISDKDKEDIAATFFDADSDGDLDLYVVSGGNEEKELSAYYQDRFYENKGDGQFLKTTNTLPSIRMSGSCVRAADFDSDGDLDLFVGSKTIPGKYPLPASSFLLKNESQNGVIIFVDVTHELAPFMSDVGMVSDAQWVDADNDKNIDLLIVGEWMSIKVIKNLGGKFIDVTDKSGLDGQTGWWFSLAKGDFDKDGDIDFIAGNLGENYKYKATPEAPFIVYAKDFDNNASLDIVLGYNENNKTYPLRGRECSSNQMPFIKEKFPSYHEFGIADMTTVFGKENLESALYYSANTFATSYVENLGDLKFKVHKIDGIAQLSSVNSILVEDFNRDGNLDALLSGNLYQSEVETPRNDASYGVLLEGNGRGQFYTPLPNEIGLFVRGDVKHASIINTASKNKRQILFAKNDSEIQIVDYEK